MAKYKVTKIYKAIVKELNTDEIKELIADLENTVLPYKQQEEDQYTITRANLGLPFKGK